tara:strand:+ start:349 stop:714 length:366 start_codon:yes stop_codon:yes gene_type:complete
LVQLSDTDPPVCKIIDYGQFLYQQKKKQKQQKKTVHTIKEIKLSPKISDHDFMIRVSRGKKFLDKKYKVKLTIFFRGREVQHHDLGVKVAERFIENLSEVGTAQFNPTKNNRTISALISPK